MGRPCLKIHKSILPPSKTTYYRNENITFFQKPNETFNEAWERFKGLIRQCPHHGFSELHQLDTFYNSLNSNDQDALELPRAGGNFLDKDASRRGGDERIIESIPPFQAPTPQNQGVSKMDFENYVKANDAVLKNVQNQASTSNPGTLPSQTVTNSRQQINAITTRSVQNLNLENTAHVPSPGEEDSIFMEILKPKAKKTVNVEIQDFNSPRLNSYQSRLPYPERMKVREHDKPSAQHSRFLKMFKQLRLEIGLKDALIEMPKFNKWLGSLLRNKEKLEEIAIMTVNAECSAIIMNKVPEKLEDPGKFLILCALQELNRTSALADSGAIINLLPHSIYKKLELEALTPTRITLELANRSITHPMGIAEDVVVRVDGFTFLADFVEKLTLSVGKEELVYYADKSEKNKEKNFVHAISIIDFSKDDPFSGSTTNTLPPSSSPMKTSDNLEKFADELAPHDSLPPGNDDLTFKKDLHEVNFQIYSNPLFKFDDNFKSSNVNPLFEENDKDVEIKSSSSFTFTSPEVSELEAYLEKDSIPPGIDLTLPPTLEISSSNPTSPIITREKIWKKIILSISNLTYINTKLLYRPSRRKLKKSKKKKMKFQDFKKDLTVSFDSTESSILPSPLLDSDSPFTAELSASVTLNSLRNEDKVFKQVFKEPSFLLPPPEPPDECLKNDVLKFYQNQKTFPLNVEVVNFFTIIIWLSLPYFLYTKESPLIFSFRSENFVFDPGIITFHNPVAVSIEVSICSP
ncbi:reverse transcriptase domain-containing protein [Tanacetum coccineum]|uniref:Reverse transcriptase domain-containing protein n=1 Tax=Tanacetum coccineum TaxID=301880 RepID=A0ABQ5FZ66_9ASTR